MTVKSSSKWPPDNFKRDKWGLLEGIKYQFRDDSTVDWRAMIKPEYTVFNALLINEIQLKYLKAIKDIKVEEVDDKYLLVLLAGFKELAAIRGYTSVTYNIAHADINYAATSCRIEWIPNYETFEQKLIFESMADASPQTTTGFGQNYLLAMAENRAFCRCVRNSLGIHVVAFDEISPKTIAPQNASAAPVAAASTMLKSVLDEKKISFIQLKEKWVEMGNDEAKKWNSLDDIPAETIFKILGKIKRK